VDRTVADGGVTVFLRMVVSQVPATPRRLNDLEFRYWSRVVSSEDMESLD
jgi:hypothetical protein